MFMGVMNRMIDECVNFICFQANGVGEFVEIVFEIDRSFVTLGVKLMIYSLHNDAIRDALSFIGDEATGVNEMLSQLLLGLSSFCCTISLRIPRAYR
ncbi:hypothetical protein CDES_12780 [Corynebacterium deserti GIMN1.010]|uniref:Uncharacterized protein n=2 Tax=Corynebacterium TaxID=1716 RepID=A0A0M4CZB4_9CORY|nr:hypothetical protein CDES_12780 [Corynebacterium deserti GIMN1.010]